MIRTSTNAGTAAPESTSTPAVGTTRALLACGGVAGPLFVVVASVQAAVMAGVLDPASPGYQGHLRFLPTRANRQPAAANYIRRPGDLVYRALAIDVLRIEDGQVVEITGFAPHLFPAFGLPATLP